MHAIIVKEPGGIDQLAEAEVDRPEIGAGEILVKVAAVGMNRADLLQREGHYPPPPGTSELLGLEVSGHVAEVGADVDGWSEGDPCVALLAGGGYGEFVAVPAGQVVRPPEGVDLVSAAGLIEVAATVVSNVADVIRPGSTFLVHGGTGGIGMFAIPYAKHLGATVATTAGTAEKLVVCRELGADIALDYHDDWVAGLKEATDKHGADVILDIMGAKYLGLNLRALATEGHLCVIGLQGGRKGELDLNLLLSKRASITATGLRFRPLEQKAAICRRVADEIWPLVADGTIKPPRETRFPISDVAKAHEHLASGDNVGKILLVRE